MLCIIHDVVRILRPNTRFPFTTRSLPSSPLTGMWAKYAPEFPTPMAYRFVWWIRCVFAPVLNAEKKGFPGIVRTTITPILPRDHHSVSSWLAINFVSWHGNNVFPQFQPCENVAMRCSIHACEQWIPFIERAIGWMTEWTKWRVCTTSPWIKRFAIYTTSTSTRQSTVCVSGYREQNLQFSPFTFFLLFSFFFFWLVANTATNLLASH